VGPYQTGKTYAGLQMAHAILCKWPGIVGMMCRQTYESLRLDTIPIYEKKVLAIHPDSSDSPITKIGKSRPQTYHYPNGSEFIARGLESDVFPECDFIFVSQAEQLRLSTWELLIRATTGRAGNMPYSVLFADAQPGPLTHWLVNSPGVTLIKSEHKDNPTLYNHDIGEWTDLGIKTMKFLELLTGSRRLRGLLGQWGSAEGQVYEYDPAVHLINRFDIPDDWPRYRVIDFGFRHPFVCGWWATDKDERLYRYREIYMSGRTTEEHGELINELSKGEIYVSTIADHDPEAQAVLRKMGIYCKNANKKSVRDRLDKVSDRLKIQADGKPAIFFMRDSLVELDTLLKENFKPTCTEEEFGGYVYPKTRMGRTADEVPRKGTVDDDGMDMVGYMVMELAVKTSYSMEDFF